MNFLKILKTIDNLNDDPTIKSIINSVNKDQIESKRWLLEKLKPHLLAFDKPKILVVAGWYGLLAEMLSKKISDEVYSLDMDPNCAKIGVKMFSDNVRFIIKDIKDYGRKHLKDYDYIICPSCEHINDDIINHILSKKRKDSIAVLQSNNYFNLKEHINCKNSLEEFENSLTLKVFDRGIKSFERYDRYMVIGV